jgi:hypothetical protein
MNIVGPVGNEATRSLPVRQVRFTYLDYLELRGWEFEKFRSMPAITQEEIDTVDWAVLAAACSAPALRSSESEGGPPPGAAADLDC